MISALKEKNKPNEDLNTKSRTAKILSIPEVERSWQYLFPREELFTHKEILEMKKNLFVKPSSNMVAEMRKKLIEKGKPKERARKKLPDACQVASAADVRPDVDEFPEDRKRKRSEYEDTHDTFDDSRTLHFPADASIIQQPTRWIPEARKLVLKDDYEFLTRLSQKEIADRTMANLLEVCRLVSNYLYFTFPSNDAFIFSFPGFYVSLDL